MAKNQLDANYSDEIIDYMGSRIDYNDYYFDLETYCFMYNDIEGNGCRVKWATNPYLDGIHNSCYYYGAKAYCTVCGEDLDNEERTICREHAKICVCSMCGEEHPKDDLIMVEDRYYCPDCYDEYCSTCPICDDDRIDNNTNTLYMFYNNEVFPSIGGVCDNCLDYLASKKYVIYYGRHYTPYITEKCPKETIEKLFDIASIEDETSFKFNPDLIKNRNQDIAS
jgi:hypothetical protein